MRRHQYDFRSLLETYADKLSQKRKFVGNDNVDLSPASNRRKRIRLDGTEQSISATQLRREVEALVCPHA